MERIREIVGLERPVTTVSQTLHLDVVSLHPPVAGAMLVTCADESEAECANAFQNGFVRYSVAAVKFGQQSAFRLANLGAQYEWGAVRIAEDHFAAAVAGREWKLMVVKINAHVGVTGEPGAERFGRFERFQGETTCCGALDGLLAGAHLPAIEHLREAFGSEQKDRLAALAQEGPVAAEHRLLHAAIASARLQARKAILDVQDHRDTTPTLWLVLPCVTINRPHRDTEVVCGYYTADHRTDARKVEYYGLGDDPERYEVAMAERRFAVGDDHLGVTRPARDHRALVRSAHAGGAPEAIHDERLDGIRSDVARGEHRQPFRSKAMLRTLLSVLAELTPVSAAVKAFAHGAAGIHHAFRVHRLTNELEGSDDARRILREIHGKVDDLEPERAQALIELLLRDYGR